MPERDSEFHRDEIVMNAIALVGQIKVKSMLRLARCLDSTDSSEARDLADIVIEIFEGDN